MTVLTERGEREETDRKSSSDSSDGYERSRGTSAQRGLPGLTVLSITWHRLLTGVNSVEHNVHRHGPRALPAVNSVNHNEAITAPPWLTVLSITWPRHGWEAHNLSLMSLMLLTTRRRLRVDINVNVHHEEAQTRPLGPMTDIKVRTMRRVLSVNLRTVNVSNVHSGLYAACSRNPE